MKRAASTRYPGAVRLTITTLLALLLCAWTPAVSYARKQREYPYAFVQVWNAALRLVRVELRCPVTDRDPEGGYVLFEYESSGKHYPASIELVAQTGDPQAATLAIVQVKGMPSYVEQMLLDRLDKKLLSEFGPPAKPKKPEPAPPSAPPAESDAGVAEPSQD